MFDLAYNSFAVLLGSASIGVAYGLCGSFLLLRGKALISDVAAHSALPGLALGFLFALLFSVDQRFSFPLLLGGAFLSSALGTVLVQLLQDYTRLRSEASMSVVLSSFYGLGVVLLSYIQALEAPGKSVLSSFLLGQAAGMTLSDAILLSLISVFVVLAVLVWPRYFTALCFDADYAGSIGFRVKVLDFVLSALMLVVICAGLKILGVILVLAMLIIPAAAAKLWAQSVPQMLLLAAIFGVVSAVAGTVLSLNLGDLPTGPAIVLSSFTLFAFSLGVKGRPA